MYVEAARKLKHGSKVSVQGKGNGHEPASIITLTVQGDAHLLGKSEQTISKIPFVWVHTNMGVWPSHRLF